MTSWYEDGVWVVWSWELNAFSFPHCKLIRESLPLAPVYGFCELFKECVNIRRNQCLSFDSRYWKDPPLGPPLISVLTFGGVFQETEGIQVKYWGFSKFCDCIWDQGRKKQGDRWCLSDPEDAIRGVKNETTITVFFETPPLRLPPTHRLRPAPSLQVFGANAEVAAGGFCWPFSFAM